MVVGNDYCARAPVGVVSREIHGTTPNEIDLLPPAPGIECRNAGPNGSHEVVVKFALPVTFQGASAMPEAGQTAEIDGPPVSTPDGKEVTVKLKNVTNAQWLTVQLLGVSDGTNTANVPIPMGVLLGDTTASGTVNTSDIGQAKASSGQPATEANFRQDVTVNGTINSSDISLIKTKSGTNLP